MSWIKKLLSRAPDAVAQQPMSIMAVIEHEREAYRSVLLQLYAQLRSLKREIFCEVQIKFGEEGVPEPYRLMRLDAFYKEGDKVGSAEANVRDPWKFSPIAEDWGGLRVTAGPLVWNGVEFRVSGPLPDNELIVSWLSKWYDSADTRSADADGLLNVVHNITAPDRLPNGWSVSIDFGSAPVDSFVQFVELIKGTGASQLEMGSFSYGPASAA